MSEKVAYTTTRYKESRRPSEDAANVGRWVIGTAIVFSSFGFAMGAGISWAAGFSFWGGVSFGFAMAGFMGFSVGILRIATYDKKPYIDIQEHKTEPVIYDDETEEQTPIRYSGNIQTKGNAMAEYNGRKYEFTSEQIRLMIDRVEQGDNTIAQNPLKFKPGDDYNLAAYVMGNLDYWNVERQHGKIKSIKWFDDGIAWLMRQTRSPH